MAEAGGDLYCACICLLFARIQKRPLPTFDKDSLWPIVILWHVYGCGSKFWRIGGGGGGGLEETGKVASDLARACVYTAAAEPTMWARAIPSPSSLSLSPSSSLLRLCSDIFHRKLPDRMSGTEDLVGRDHGAEVKAGQQRGNTQWKEYYGRRSTKLAKCDTQRG